MVVLVGDTAAMQVVAQQRRELEETKADAARLSGRDRNKDSFYLQVTYWNKNQDLTVCVSVRL